MLSIKLLNHACAVVHFKKAGVKIGFDPWLFGHCFDEGWGLKYDNPDAIKEVSECDYIWISHFHADHFHVPTLKKILSLNP